ncbi:MAG: hypothetical protein ACOXZ4_02465 [Sphaerochaetaceae bacterium]
MADGNNEWGFANPDKSVALDVNPAGTMKGFGGASDAYIQGVEVGYQDFKVGFGFNNWDNTGVFNMYGALLTPSFDLADGVSAQAGAAFSVIDDALAFSGSLKGAYAADDLKVTAAADAVYANDKFDADVAVAAAYDDYNLDVYFATKGDANFYVGEENIVSVKVAAKIDPVVVTVYGKNLINDQILGGSVKFNATDELAVTGRGEYTIASEAWKGGADVVYTTDDFVAKLGGTYHSTERVQLNASIESATVVPGALLKLAYAGDDLTEVDGRPSSGAGSYDNGDKGSITASVKIAF